LILYLDSSSLAKLYVQEGGSELVRPAARSNSLATSLVAYTEMRALFARIRREGRHSPGEHDVALGDFERDWQSMITVEVTESLVRRAGALADQYALRGFDAVHLSSALTLRAEASEPVTFSAFDGRLRDAAVACGLAVL
jgi:predicted nucleic acid-binding protein